MRKASENKITKKQAEKNLVSAASVVEPKPLESQAVEVKAVEAKSEAKDEKKTVEVKKEKAAKASTKRETKAATAKKESKPATKSETKTPRKKSGTAAKLTLQVEGRDDLAMDSLIERVKAAYVAEGHKASTIKDIEVYIKLSENMAYYVIDGYASGISLY